MSEREAWREYFKLCLTEAFSFGSDDPLKLEKQVAWASRAAFAALEEERRRFPEPPAGQTALVTSDRPAHVTFSMDDLRRLLKLARGYFEERGMSDEEAQALAPFKEIR